MPNLAVVVISYRDMRGSLHPTKAAALQSDKIHFWWELIGDNYSRSRLAEDLARTGLDPHIKALAAIEKRYQDV